MRKTPLVSGALALVLLGGCVTPPSGPNIPVMPGDGKSFADFQKDDDECQDFASDHVAGRADTANDHAILSAIIGAGLGAALGGAVGGGHGAGVGAAAGGIAGTAVGANQSAYAQGNLQRRYDIAYAQCMRAKGNKVPDDLYQRNWHRRYYRDYGPPPPPPPPPGY
ncbi:MAG TPA: hypothetical protein VMU01_13025 [Rhizomicrobium sp.]|nr:hypothetical protein [Rhizomicrobium sp.]